jgi:glycosyltransferase involved in cell wall biosynthesis
VLRDVSSRAGVAGAWAAVADKTGRYAKAGARALSHSRPRRYGPGDMYLNVSHFGLEQPGLLPRLTRRGVRPMAMIHDLIPIEHPEYCSPSASVWHRRRIDELLEYGVLLVTNSKTTASDVAAYAEEYGLDLPQVCVAPLGLEPEFLEPARAAQAAGSYFVCVGTIEPRKNLTFLLTLWRRLADRMGDATPPLVLVGQRGWENESVIDHLDRSPPILRFVHEVNDLSNDELARLIGGARALLSPSFSEGFNLPVAEALAMGVPVIASDIAVHRELAGNAHLIDPLDGPAWLAAIEGAAARRPPSRISRALSWRQHFAIVAEAMRLGPVESERHPARAL